MISRFYPWMALLVLFSALILALVLLHPNHANAQPPQQ
jgi:hypothetical protein